jgi:hypothetical protein
MKLEYNRNSPWFSLVHTYGIHYPMKAPFSLEPAECLLWVISGQSDKRSASGLTPSANFVSGIRQQFPDELPPGR